jgi:hypothetical protein
MAGEFTSPPFGEANDKRASLTVGLFYSERQREEQMKTSRLVEFPPEAGLPLA